MPRITLIGTNNEDKIIYKDLSYKIVGLAMQVHGTLDYGFLEKVYENALMILLRKTEIKSEQQVAIPVYFEEEKVGDFYADILVENKIILELKSVEKIINAHRAQVINYLKGTDLRLGILLNFGKDGLEFERLVW